MKRQVIEVEGLSHAGQPIPLAVRKGPMLVSGSISGRDRATGQRPDEWVDELAHAFDNLEAILIASGMTLDSVMKVDVALASLDLRSSMNAVWLQRFPLADDRPVRHTVAGSLPGDLRIQMSVVAYD